jgi:hypothetical protein
MLHARQPFSQRAARRQARSAPAPAAVTTIQAPTQASSMSTTFLSLTPYKAPSWTTGKITGKVPHEKFELGANAASP